MALDTNSLGMVVFLFFGAAANLPFFCRSLLDMFPQRPLLKAMPSAAPALLTTALAELCWVLPCLVQCAIQLFNGDGPWSPSISALGCDTMAFYSVFASLTGMTSTLWIAILTFRASRNTHVSARASSVAGFVIIAGSAFVAALPLMGVGNFAFTGEGFCYIDWHSKPSAIIMLMITLPTIVATVALLLLAACKPGGWPSRFDLILMLIAFVSAWLLWVPASLIGLAGQPFPKGYMITGGVMGHAQALINPYVYGIRWRSSAFKLTVDKAAKVSDAKPSTTDVPDTPSTAEAMPTLA